MKFQEWYKDITNDDGHDDFWTKNGLEKAWNAAIDEAVKTIKKESFYDDEISADYIADNIKELKN